MSRILLTGATGLVGGAMLRMLDAQPNELMVLARNPAALTHKGITVACDLADITAEAAQEIKQFAPEKIVHCGWIGTTNADRNDPRFMQMNLESNLRLLDITLEAGCTQWISFGSQAEYSPDIMEDIAESAPTNPDNNYGVAKLNVLHAQQSVCAEAGIDFTWLRLFTCYGREYKSAYLIPYLIDLLRRGVIPELRTPNAVWDLLHVDDAADAVKMLLGRDSVNGVYNLAYGKGVSVAEIALTLARLLHFPEIEALRAQMAASTVPETRRVADMGKFSGDFGWKPKTGLTDGLAKCL
jgi:UDP-glucose 4-epimerase